MRSKSPEVRRLSERRVTEEGDGRRLPMPPWAELDSVSGASAEGLSDGERRS